MFEYTENDLGKQTETHGMGESYLLTQKSDFDLKLAKKWSQLMEKGSFRYCFDGRGGYFTIYTHSP